MVRRCNQIKNKSFKNYGVRGITVCKRWMKFENFYKDMGNPPKDLTLDRINNDKGYSKSNCKWSTIEEQSNNRRSNKLLNYKGKVYTLKQASDKFDISYTTLRSRLRRGWSDIRAIEEVIREVY